MSGIWPLIAPVPVHCFSITFIEKIRQLCFVGFAQSNQKGFSSLNYLVLTFHLYNTHNKKAVQ